MKTCEEKTQRVFQKIKEAEAKQIKRSRTVRIAAPLLAFCLVAAVGFGAWQNGAFRKPPVISDEHGMPVPDPDGTIQRTEMPDTFPTHPILRPGDDGYVAPVPTLNPEALDNNDADEPEHNEAYGAPDAPPQPDDGQASARLPADETVFADNNGSQEENGVCINSFSVTQWGNKTLLPGLADALDKAPADKVFDILARPYIDYQFVYGGRTLAEYYSDMCDERNLPEILAQLLKEGDSLKYGAALYESGTPDGEKWAQSFYEERVAFYGTAILDRYIADGEFLRGQAESDLEAAKTAKEATVAYKAAFAAYYQHLVDTMQLSVPADAKGTDGIVLHMTAVEFRNFTAEHIEAWTFNLDGSGSAAYETSDD